MGNLDFLEEDTKNGGAKFWNGQKKSVFFCGFYGVEDLEGAIANRKVKDGLCLLSVDKTHQ